MHIHRSGVDFALRQTKLAVYMDELPENLQFGLSYADFSPTQQTSHDVIHGTDSPHTLHSTHLDDSLFGSRLTYPTFPLMHPPHLQQPAVDIPKPKSAKPQSRPTRVRAEGMPPPIRVTRPPNAFLLFNKEMRKRLKDQNPSMKVAEISKEIGERWKALAKDEKDRFVEEANRIKESQRAMHPNSMYIRRSKAELTKAGHYKAKPSDSPLIQSPTKNDSPVADVGQLFSSSASAFISLSNGIPRTSSQPQRKKTRRDKNPGAPKHPLSAYMWYLTEVRPETMRAYPGSTVGQVSKLCAGRWNAMSETERAPWTAKANTDKARYAREMQIYAAQTDHPMGRGTRQKYRLTTVPTATLERPPLLTIAPHTMFLDDKGESSSSQQQDLSEPTSPSSILRNALPGAMHIQDTMSPNSLLHTPELRSSSPEEDTAQYVHTEQ